MHTWDIQFGKRSLWRTFTFYFTVFSCFLLSSEAIGQTERLKINRPLEEHQIGFDSNDRRLIAHYLDLAEKQRYENGKQAVASLSEALRIERIHSGDMHSKQIPIIEAMIEIQLEVGDWYGAEKNLGLLIRLNKKRRHESVDEWRENLSRIVKTYLVLSERGGIRGYLDLIKTLPLVDSGLESLVNSSHERDDWLTLKAALSYKAAKEAEHLGQQSHWTAGSTSDEHLRYRRAVALHLSAGIQALEEAQKNAKEKGNIQRRAKSTLHLADWYLLTGKMSMARQLYTQVYAMREEVDVYNLDSLRLLPSFGLERGKHEIRTTRKNIHLAKARFDVDNEGRPYNIDIIEMEYPLSPSVHQKAKQMLKKTRFRPALSLNDPSGNELVELHFAIKEPGDSSSQKTSTFALRIILSLL